MDDFSFIVLENTLELATESMSMTSDRVTYCVNVIRASMELMIPGSSERGTEEEFRQALIELSNIAHQKRQFLIAARLDSIARDLYATNADVA